MYRNLILPTDGGDAPGAPGASPGDPIRMLFAEHRVLLARLHVLEDELRFLRARSASAVQERAAALTAALMGVAGPGLLAPGPVTPGGSARGGNGPLVHVGHAGGDDLLLGRAQPPVGVREDRYLFLLAAGAA